MHMPAADFPKVHCSKRGLTIACESDVKIMREGAQRAISELEKLGDVDKRLDELDRMYKDCSK